MEWINNNIWLVIFFVWGLPLGYYRSKFRKIVYQTDSWTININPRFVKETRALIGNIYPEDVEYLKQRSFYRIYLSVYMVLFVLYIIFNQEGFISTALESTDFQRAIDLFQSVAPASFWQHLSSIFLSRNMCKYSSDLSS